MDTANMPDDEKFLYLLMYAPGNALEFNESLPGEIWLEKQIFLLKTTVPEIKLGFDKGRFGAYCGDLNRMLTKCIESGDIIQPYDGHGPLWLSEKGQGIGRRLWVETDEHVRDDVSYVKKFMNDLSYDELTAYSYSTFPDTAVNSEIWKRFQSTRVGAACSMFEREKITLEKAASIAGMVIEEFIRILEKRGTPAYSISRDDFHRSLKEVEHTRHRCPDGS